MEVTKAIMRASGIDLAVAEKLQEKDSQGHGLCEDCIAAIYIDLVSANHVATIGGNTNLMISTCEATGISFPNFMKRRSKLPERLEFRLKHL